MQKRLLVFGPQVDIVMGCRYGAADQEIDVVYPSSLPKVLLITCTLLLGACNGDAPSPAPHESSGSAAAYHPTATFQEIMDSVVDPSADFVWNSVSTMSDESGIHEKQPRTDEEWHEVRRHAIVLAEAANLIAVPGRRVANGSTTVENKDALDVTTIQQRLDTRHEELVGFASAMREIAVRLVAAADKKDTVEITDLGGTLDEVCESCHKVFWYPELAPNAASK